MLIPAALAPAALIAFLVHRYGVNVPFWDQWMLVDPLIEMELGRFPWANVFSQHNEHRMVFPKLVMLGLAQLTRWNTLAEMWCSVVLAGVCLVMLLALARPTLNETGPVARLWAVAMLSTMVFSLAQWENWFWGFQLTWFLGTLAAIAVVALTTWSLDAPRPWRYVAGAAFSAIVCQYSIGSGLAVWVSGAMVLAFHRDWRSLLSAWIVIAIVAIAIFFIGYVKPPTHPPLTAAVERPAAFMAYLGNYLAGPLGRHAAIGYFVAVTFVLLGAVLLPRLRREPRLVLPWIAIGAFAGANAVLTGIGRAGMGAEQGMSSRYVTIASLLSIALVPLGLLVLRNQKPARVASAVLVGGAGLLSVLVLLSDVRSVQHVVNEGGRLRQARECVLRLDEASDECVSKLYPNAQLVREWHKQLQILRWSGFPDDEKQPRGMLRVEGLTDARLWRLRPVDGPSGWLDAALYDGSTLSVSGWASRPAQAPADSGKVMVTVGSAMRAETRFVDETNLSETLGPVVTPRGDLGRVMSRWMVQMPGLPSSGWPLRFRAYLILSDSELVPIGGGATIGEVVRLAGDSGVQVWRLLPGTARAGVLDSAELKNRMLSVAGWASPLWDNSVAPRRVLVAAGDTLIGETVTSRERPDVSAHFRDPRLLRSGWTLEVGVRERPASPLRAFVVIGEDLLMPLAGAVAPR